MDLFLSPNGRIDQATYWRGVIILLVISIAISAISAFVNPFIGMLGILFIWPWIAVHVKRFHDSGKSGWLTIAIVVAAMIISLILGAILPGLFGVDMAGLQAEMQREIEDITSDGDPSEMMSVMTQWTQRIAQAQLLPNLVSTAIVTGLIGVIMGAINKTDPNDNKFGPGPAGSTFA